MSYEEYRLRQENAALCNRLNSRRPSLAERLADLKEVMKSGRFKVLPTKEKPRR